mgnify:FL=1
MDTYDIFRVASAPLDIVWADRDANLAAVDAIVDKVEDGTDLLVLPELFSTAYVNDPQLLADIAETNTGRTVDRLKEWASRRSIAIAGSFLARTAHRYYNRAFFIEPSGEETYYDKRHLFSLSDEAKVYAQGVTNKPIIRFRGWNISMIVCYDLRFPVWCRSIRNSYDLLLVPSNWPQARGYAFEHLLIARAIENQAAVVGANRGGEDEYGKYDGLSYIFDSNGKPVARRDERTGLLYAELSRGRLRTQRERFPVVYDADEFRLTAPEL